MYEKFKEKNQNIVICNYFKITKALEEYIGMRFS